MYSTFQLCLLILASHQDNTPLHNWSVAATATTFVAGLFILALSSQEHAKSQRTSSIINLYLLLSLLFDAVQTRTLWLSWSTHQLLFARIFTTSVALKCTLLVFEAQGKHRWLKHWDNKLHSPEETSGMYSLSVYFWLRQLFLHGFKSTLALDDLYGLDSKLSAEVAGGGLLAELQAGQNLLKSLVKEFSWQILLPVLPNLTLIAFQYAQPFFLEALLEYLDRAQNSNPGYGLIGACVLIYVGLAVSTAFSGYYTERTKSMARAYLCAAIYRKTTEIPIKDAADRAGLTLMSTDIEHVEIGIRHMHSMWASLVKVGIGCWLLYEKFGIVFITPIFIIVVCSAILFWVVTLIDSFQATWMEKIQSRVGLTASAIANMKHFKMLGVADKVADLVQKIRSDELHVGSKFRMTLCVAFSLSIIPAIAAPVLVFALTTRELNTSSLFVSLSYMTLLATPLSTLFRGLPQCLAALTSLRRIEAFLQSESRRDCRQWNALAAQDLVQGKGDPSKYKTSTKCESLNADTKLDDAGAAVVIRNGSFARKEDTPVLKDINISIPRGKLTMVVGV